MNDYSLKFCPVPFEQQPMNEYQQLQNSWFFQWATLEKINYWQKLSGVWLWSWIVVGPIAASSFTPQKHPIEFALTGTAGAGIFVSLLVLRLYLGWYYVLERLKAEKICYEESGWYDGQTWEKPEEILDRDRLIASYQVEPILSRLRKTAYVLIILVGLGSLIWLMPR